MGDEQSHDRTSVPRPDLNRARGCPRCKGAGVLAVVDRVGMKTTRLCLCQKQQRYITKTKEAKGVTHITLAATDVKQFQVTK